MKTQGTSVAISLIRIDGGTQTIAGIRADLIEEYAAIVATGGDLPDAVVFDDGDHLWMADSFHRREAYLEAGKTKMSAKIILGSKRDALLYSAWANSKQASDRWIAEKLAELQTLGVIVKFRRHRKRNGGGA